MGRLRQKIRQKRESEERKKDPDISGPKGSYGFGGRSQKKLLDQADPKKSKEKKKKKDEEEEDG